MDTKLEITTEIYKKDTLTESSVEDIYSYDALSDDFAQRVAEKQIESKERENSIFQAVLDNHLENDNTELCFETVMSARIRQTVRYDKANVTDNFSVTGSILYILIGVAMGTILFVVRKGMKRKNGNTSMERDKQWK